MTNTRTALSTLALAALLAVLAACSSTATTVEAADTAPAPVESAEADPPREAEPEADQAAPTEPDAVATAEPETAEPEAAEASPDEGAVDIAFDDGRSWTLVATDCRVEPESPFGVFFMGGSNDEGAELNVVESWPLDGDRSRGTAFIATFIDETGEIFVLDAAEVQQVGDSLTFTTGIYEGVFATEITAQGTFTCTL